MHHWWNEPCPETQRWCPDIGIGSIFSSGPSSSWGCSQSPNWGCFWYLLGNVDKNAEGCSRGSVSGTQCKNTVSGSNILQWKHFLTTPRTRRAWSTVWWISGSRLQNESMTSRSVCNLWRSMLFADGRSPDWDPSTKPCIRGNWHTALSTCKACLRGWIQICNHHCWRHWHSVFPSVQRCTALSLRNVERQTVYWVQRHPQACKRYRKGNYQSLIGLHALRKGIRMSEDFVHRMVCFVIWFALSAWRTRGAASNGLWIWWWGIWTKLGSVLRI